MTNPQARGCSSRSPRGGASARKRACLILPAFAKDREKVCESETRVSARKNIKLPDGFRGKQLCVCG